MGFPDHKTKIVATIGPASESEEILRQMIEAGMNVARLNFSHGDFDSHARMIQNIRAAAQAVNRRVAILADLPGPKIRIGVLEREPLFLEAGASFTLTVEPVKGTAQRVSVTLPELPSVVHPGDTVFLNDGLIELRVQSAKGPDVNCEVVVGGELRSRKGLNLPGVDLGISAFTDADKKWLAFAMAQGVDAVSQSFVNQAADIQAVRAAAQALGNVPFIVAKIERATAIQRFDEILEAADGIMIARGDLGVETPIEEIAILQKKLIQKTRQTGKPVITATQMLESMTASRRPTRAESTDVANAILDGADCVMLSEESANGMFPVAAVSMLARIAAQVEPYLFADARFQEWDRPAASSVIDLRDLVSMSVRTAVLKAQPAVVIVPTRTGASARSIARYRLPVWIAAVSPLESTCQQLMFSYGVYPVYHPDHPRDWTPYVRSFFASHELAGDIVILTEGPSVEHPSTAHRMEIIDIRRG